MTARTQYEKDVFTTILAPFRPAPAISDETRDDETRACDMLKAAYAQFVSVAQDSAALSTIQGEIEFLRGRLKFGGHKNSAPFPSAIVTFQPTDLE